MRVHIESDWLQSNLHRWRGAITISHQTVFQNWWGEPYKGPVGLAGRPRSAGAFVLFKADGADIYVAQDIWEHLTGEICRLSALLPGYGMACFRFERRDEESNLWTGDGVL